MQLVATFIRSGYSVFQSLVQKDIKRVRVGARALAGTLIHLSSRQTLELTLQILNVIPVFSCISSLLLLIEEMR